MKTNLCLLLCMLGLGVFPLYNSYGQENVNPDSPISHDYDVQRIYDEKGNLIYYDSTLVSGNNFSQENAEYDSLLSIWKEEERILDYSIRFPKDSFSFSFQLPGGIFKYAPEYEFDIDVPDFDTLLKNFDYHFSLTPSDTSVRKDTADSYYEFHGKVPRFDPDFNQTLWEIERRVLQFHNHIKDEYEEWEDKRIPRSQQEPEQPEKPEKLKKPKEPSQQIDI